MCCILHPVDNLFYWYSWRFVPLRASQGAVVVKNLSASAGDTGDMGLIPGSGGATHSSVFLPGKSHGQRSLVGYSLWGSQRVKHDWACMHLVPLNSLHLFCPPTLCLAHFWQLLLFSVSISLFSFFFFNYTYNWDHMVFVFPLLSSILPSRFTHVVANDNISFL